MSSTTAPTDPIAPIAPTAPIARARGAPPALLQPARPAGRRERSITVETEALGLVKVRRVSLGGIARCADRLRADRSTDDDALVDALIGEVATIGTGAGGRRPDAAQIGRLSDSDRSSIAAAVLTLEGVKAAGEGVLQNPLTSLVQRYGPVVGLRDRRRPPASLILADAAPNAAQVAEYSLPGHAESVAIAAEPEPQIPLFDGAQLPPAPHHRLPDHDAGAPAPARAARVAAERSLAHFQELLDAQQHRLLEVADEHRALTAEVAALAARAERAETRARRSRWAAAAVLGIALLLTLAQAMLVSRSEQRLAAEQQRLRTQVLQQGEALKELRNAAPRAAAPRPPVARPPAQPNVSRERARPAGSGR